MIVDDVGVGMGVATNHALAPHMAPHMAHMAPHMALHNPNYTGEVVHSELQRATARTSSTLANGSGDPLYAEIDRKNLSSRNKSSHTINIPSRGIESSASLSPLSDSGSNVSPIPSPYLVPRITPRLESSARANSTNQVVNESLQNPTPYSELNLQTAGGNVTRVQNRWTGDRTVHHGTNAEVVDISKRYETQQLRNDGLQITSSTLSQDHIYESIKANSYLPPSSSK